MNFESLKTCCLITGASRGFGKVFAEKVSNILKPGSLMILISRSKNELTELKNDLGKRKSDIDIEISLIDLQTTKQSDLELFFDSIFPEEGGNYDKTSYEQLLIVHNAASLGDVTKRTVEHRNERMLNDYWALNLTSPILLNSIFLDRFRNLANTEEAAREATPVGRFIVNVSSLSAKQPFKCMSLYCAGKAARHMLFSTMAQEEPSLQVLSYCPGPMRTAMYMEAASNFADLDSKSMFQGLLDRGTILECDVSVDKLLKLLAKGFQSGSHIDYYDLDSEGNIL